MPWWLTALLLGGVERRSTGRLEVGSTGRSFPACVSSRVPCAEQGAAPIVWMADRAALRRRRGEAPGRLLVQNCQASCPIGVRAVPHSGQELVLHQTKVL